MKNYSSGSATTLAGGTTTAPGTGTWHTLGLTFQGTQITATVDGNTVSTVNDSTFLSGQVGIGHAGFLTGLSKPVIDAMIRTVKGIENELGYGAILKSPKPRPRCGRNACAAPKPFALTAA